MEPVKVFNNVVLGQFVLTGVPVKVYVDSRFLTIIDSDDIEDPLIGFGMDEDGDMIRFDYRNIQKLSVSGNEVTLDTYNKGMGATEDPEEGGEEETEEEETEDDAVAPKEESFIRLSEISKDVLKAKIDVIKQQEKELKDKENTLKKEPIDEDHQQYTFGTGDIIKNINPKCKHFGSQGIVKSVGEMPGHGTIVIYTVTNNGDTYRPGMSLTKTVDQLEKI